MGALQTFKNYFKSLTTPTEYKNVIDTYKKSAPTAWNAFGIDPKAATGKITAATTGNASSKLNTSTGLDRVVNTLNIKAYTEMPPTFNTSPVPKLIDSEVIANGKRLPIPFKEYSKEEAAAQGEALKKFIDTYKASPDYKAPNVYNSGVSLIGTDKKGPNKIIDMIHGAEEEYNKFPKWKEGLITGAGLAGISGGGYALYNYTHPEEKGTNK